MSNAVVTTKSHRTLKAGLNSEGVARTHASSHYVFIKISFPPRLVALSMSMQRLSVVLKF